ncbi:MULTISPECIES: tRNA lysidine(34) synthetase TilS [Sphingomonas]|uniref:tRNA lysidine(34) synthetase TilS n=1 Tax=Sphingomonas TaxID=13687 RepID=UPI000DEEEBF3|nr:MULTISPECIES: tRNA lysidine(34) synthetase TilS [Sphingomonas]
MPLRPDERSVERVRRSLAALIGDHESTTVRVGVAVSGGPDSTALLLLAAAACPGRVMAATVDHRFRADSANDASHVALLCAQLGVAHDILTLDWQPPAASRQARARAARYAALARWAAANKLTVVATAHHLDDQAETLLMRLHRGAGVGGLAGVRPQATVATDDGPELHLVRPLLDWRRAELAAIVTVAGVETVDDPANRDPAHDRTGARAWLAASPAWPDRRRLGASADHLRQATEALDWSADRLLAERGQQTGDGWAIDLADVPAELRRRLALRLIERLRPTGPPVRGDRLDRALLLLQAGRVATLGGVVIRPRGGQWHFAPAPPRRP